jgi:hypothetical protein
LAVRISALFKIFFFLYCQCSLLNVGWRAAAEQIGEIYKLRAEQVEDPLLDAVGVLEFNYKNARDMLQRTRHVLTRFLQVLPEEKERHANHEPEKACRCV